MTSILQFSDVHFGVEDRDAMAAVRDMAISLKPDVTLICGDITQSGKTEEFQNAARWIDALPGPKLITPGNHDTPMFGLIRRLTRPFAGYEKFISPLSVSTYHDKHVAITSLNTARGWQLGFDWSLGVVDLDDLTARVEWLGAIGEGLQKMLICHHPFVYPESSPLQKSTKNGPEGLSLLERHKISAILSGHVHAPFFIDRGEDDSDLLSIGSGTLSTRGRGVPPSFNHILAKNDALTVTPIAWVDGAYIQQAQWFRGQHQKDAIVTPNAV